MSATRDDNAGKFNNPLAVGSDSDSDGDDEPSFSVANPTAAALDEAMEIEAAATAKDQGS